jgi:hypothetical protein
MSERYTIEFALAIILITITFYHFYKRYKKPKTIILNDVAIWLTGFAFGFAPFVFVYSGGSFQENKIIDVIMSYLGIFLFLFGLYIVGKLNLSSNRSNKNKENYFSSFKEIVTKISTKEVFFFYSLFFIIRLYIGIEYNLFVSGSGTEANILILPYMIVLLRSFIDLFLYTSIVWSISILLVKKKFLILPFLIILSEFLISFFQGRRPILFLIFSAFFVFIVLGYRINKQWFAFVVILLFLANTLIFPDFLMFRNYYSSDPNKTNLIDDIAYNLKLTFMTKQNTYDYLENIKVRSYINDWNIPIIAKSGIYNGLHGNIILLSASWIIPKFLFPNKYSIISPEYLINVYAGNYNTDSPENLIGYGFADFGLLGALIYGVMFGIILFLVEKLAIKIKDKQKYASLLLISSFIFVAFSVEQGLISVFSMLRSALIVFVILALLKFFKDIIKSHPKTLL